jgi:hypothetical protein
MSQPDGNIHTVPLDDYEPHIESSQCWCQPVMVERGPSGIEAWVHNRAKDLAQ